MSDNEEEIAEKDAQIERLKALNREERQTIEKLAKHCLRAADALEKWTITPSTQQLLIAELQR